MPQGVGSERAPRSDGSTACSVEADYCLEHAQALSELIRTICASANEKEWIRNRTGLTIIANQLSDSLSAARAAIDDV